MVTITVAGIIVDDGVTGIIYMEIKIAVIIRIMENGASMISSGMKKEKRHSTNT